MANTDFSSQYLSDDLYDEDKVALSEFHSQRFWPEGLIDKLINEDVVRRELDRAYKHQYDDDLVDFTLNKAKKLFAITATVDSRPEWLLSAMNFFKANSFQDSNLLPEIENNSESTAHSPNFSDRLATLNPTLWRQAMKSKFFEAQWKAMVPVFSTAKTTSDFNLKTILPFTEVERSIKGGAFSRIYKVAIHRDHYKSDDSPEGEKPTYFAVKEIVPPDKDERKRINESWVNEADALRKMNILNRANIVRFITAFTQGGADTDKSYYLMFEWADGGNLEDLWDQNPKPELSAELIHEAVIQLKGLSAALSATHNQEHGVGYRHGDLKPENILRFQPKPESIFGTLKIGDWGLAKYHNTATVLRGENTTTKYGTTFYEPPEVELGRVKILGRQYDIWSMGCIILELIIWLLYGYAEVKRFRSEVKGNSKRQLPCYKIMDHNDGDQLTAKVHEVVMRWMDHIAQDPACAEELALGELLNLVRKELIVVELPPEKGQTFFIKGYSPPVRQVPTTPTPQIAVTAPSSRTGEFDQRRARRPQAYRTLSAELLKYLEDRILDDEDRVHDFWLRTTPLDFKRRAPPNIARKPSSDSTGLLVPGRESHGRKRQTSGDRSNTSDKRRLEVQEQKFVSKDHLLPFTSVPADQ